VHVCVLENHDIWSAETQIDRRTADFDAMQRENDHPVTRRNLGDDGGFTRNGHDNSLGSGSLGKCCYHS
jgi:hypothetical protein